MLQRVTLLLFARKIKQFFRSKLKKRKDQNLAEEKNLP
jgi:hypothetical protein